MSYRHRYCTHTTHKRPAWSWWASPLIRRFSRIVSSTQQSSHICIHMLCMWCTDCTCGAPLPRFWRWQHSILPFSPPSPHIAPLAHTPFSVTEQQGLRTPRWTHYNGRREVVKTKWQWRGIAPATLWPTTYSPMTQTDDTFSLDCDPWTVSNSCASQKTIY